MKQPSRTTVRAWTTLAGGVLVAAALLVTGVFSVEPRLLEPLQWSEDDVLLVAGFFTLTFTAGTLLLALDGLVEADGPTLPEPEPETTPPIPRAGAEFDRLVDGGVLSRRLTADERRQVRSRLRHAAVETVRRRAEISRERAEVLVERGEWTDDATAAAFLGQPARPRAVRLCDRVASGVAFRHGARRTAREIVTYANGSER
jgi:hypothetical protein